MQRSAGFSLAEVLVGTGILTGAVIMAAVMNGLAGFGLLGSTTVNSRDALIDADVAAIRGDAEAYTWCSGTGSLQPADPCEQDRKSPAYYAPPASNDPANNSAMVAFEQACTNDNANETLNGTLIAAINGRPALPGISRTAAAVQENGTPTNRIRIRYTSADAGADANPISRSVEITPTVVAWCP
jgi:hypothetical protein